METKFPTPQELQAISPAEQLKTYNDALVQKCDELLVGDFGDNALVATPGVDKRLDATLTGVSRVTDPIDGKSGFRVHPAHRGNEEGYYEVYADTPPVWVSLSNPQGPERVPVQDQHLPEGQHTEHNNRDTIGAFRSEALTIMGGQTFDNRKHVIVGSRIMDKRPVRVLGARAANWLRHL